VGRASHARDAFTRRAASAAATLREVEVVLPLTRTHVLEMARARIPALSRHITVAGAVVAHRSATREVQVVLDFAGAHPLEMARAWIPALLGAIVLGIGGCRCASQ